MTGDWCNWAGTARCQPLAQLRPASEDELGAILRRAAAEGRPVKVVGAGHSWSDIACTSGYQVQLDRLDRVLAIDLDRRELTVEAGLRLRRLVAVLAALGWTLPVVGSILEQSVAGAISTGTHGSAVALGNLSTQVVALRLMLASGELRDVAADREPELFAAARIGLGALGVITRVTLRAVPAFRLVEDAAPLPFDEVLAQLPALVVASPYLKLWWMPHTPRVQVYRCAPTAAESTLHPSLSYLDELINRHLFTRLLATTAWRPGLTAPINRLVGAAYFRPRQRVGANTDILPVAMPPLHEETEYALPIADAGEALRYLRDVIRRERLLVNFPVELRFVAGDDAWLSPMYERASCCVGVYMAAGRSLGRYFAAFEDFAMSRGGRPHWGKQFAAPASYLRSVYPRYDRFVALRRQLDPERRFDNDFLRRVLR